MKKWVFWTIMGMYIMIAIILCGMISYETGYLAGQIDALNGKQHYHYSDTTVIKYKK